MSLPTPDAQSSRYLPQQPRQHQPDPQAAFPTHSMAAPGVSGPQALQAYRALHTIPTPPASQPTQNSPMPRTPQAPFMPAVPQPVPFPGTPFPPPTAPAGPVLSPVELSDQSAHERAIDFASHSWDLATGGLKTLTAKRELPPLSERMLSGKLQEPVDSGPSHSYAFILVLMVCLVLLLFSAGVVLYVMLQP